MVPAWAPICSTPKFKRWRRLPASPATAICRAILRAAAGGRFVQLRRCLQTTHLVPIIAMHHRVALLGCVSSKVSGRAKEGERCRLGTAAPDSLA
jgi:hypothetical protein